MAYNNSPIEKKDIQQLMSSVNRALSHNLKLDYLKNHSWKTEWLDFVNSKNDRMQTIFESIRSVAPTNATVLIFGETGTGKGMTARLIHQHSLRFKKPFVSIHCGAIPDTLIESELFGYEKGAFTGADRQKQGKFEMAKGGTIFLDEIGTITPSAQIKLLQVLQEGVFTRIGGESSLNTDVRIIAATNADLAHQVAIGGFRKDLYYRLNIFPINIPPLKERPEDLAHLTAIFLNRLNAKYEKGISRLHPSLLPAFQKYDWPGNIRELENLLERAYILEDSPQLMPHNFPLKPMLGFDSEIPGSDTFISISQARQQSIQQFENSYLKALMTKAKGRIQTAAGMAGISTRQLSRLLNRYGLNKDDYKTKSDA
ncbi:sigma-54 interaction domain-containing protein [Desulfobacter curvatus]|uniref:sigma-54 interaction domain-containing protein n=1 Tax=Desulfobacter curvatus TaxID=2290 RepID=UPI00037D8196|nr:sigma-54 dependent transcriptional regulator [Desulfobacter curvatus]